MSTVRERTLSHLHRLARATAAVGAAQIGACHYAVVDMLPDPASCQDTSKGAWLEAVSATAMWVTGAEGTEIRVELQLSTFVIEGLTLGDAVTATGASVVEVTPEGGSTESIFVRIVVDKGATSAVVTVPLTCGAEEGGVDVRLDFDPADPGAGVTLALSPV